MEHPSVLIESMREFQNELDAKNQIALQQLNKDIDLLNSLPPGNLPEYDNKIDNTLQALNHETMPNSLGKVVNASNLEPDLSARLTEIKEFNASFVPLSSEQKRRENIEALMSFARTDKNQDSQNEIQKETLLSSNSLDALHQEMDTRDKEFKKSMQEFTSRLEGLQTPIDQLPTSQIPQTLGSEIPEPKYQTQQSLPNPESVTYGRQEHHLPTPEIPEKPYNPANWKDNAQADNIMNFKETLSRMSLLSPDTNRNVLDAQVKRETVPLKYEGSQELLPKFASVLSAPDLSIPDFEKKYLQPTPNVPSTFYPSATERNPPAFTTTKAEPIPTSFSNKRSEPVGSSYNNARTDHPPSKSDYVLPSLHLLDSIRLQDSGLPPRANNLSNSSTDIHESQESSKAIVNALRILQDRVGKLETEKSQARLKIHDLERELTSTKKLLRQNPITNHQEQFSPSRQVYSQSPQVSPTKSNSDRGTLDSTMKNILDARQKVDQLKERVDHVRHLAEGSQLNHSSALPTNLSADFGESTKFPDNLADFGSSGKFDINLGLKNVNQDLGEGKYGNKIDSKRNFDTTDSQSYGRILQSHADKILKKEGAIVNNYSPPTAHSSPKSSPKQRSKSPERNAQDEIKKLREDILKEKEIRMGSSTDAAFIKDKLMQKLKTSNQLKNGQRSDDDLPTWKKPSERPRSASRPASSHIRKRSPIDIPSMADKGGREMPFIIGKNTGKSFSVTANLQKVFSMLKSHNPEMCSVCSKKHPTHQHHRYVDQNPKPNNAVNHKRQTSAPPSKVKPISKISSPVGLRKQDFEQPTNESLQHILGILEQEYRDSKTQYTQLVKQYESVAESMTTKAISENTGSATLKAIGNDLRHVIQNIEAKSDQISIIRDIISSSMSIDHKHSKNRKLVPANPQQKRYTMDTLNSRSRSREADKKKDLEWKRNRARSQSPGRAMASLSLLKSTLKVQNALS